ncbi:hypothetical protein B9T31_15240 [Acinetobacter sp. ANC 4558]|uniref:beta-sandwich lipoprotein n=1 Tax=Acinetobacter sp. ANC 4558 TaxID=1977876 RepID=UPI000A340FDF|nr:hypothetical protein [Acinetobacter sp. ANC 4558]OTG81869.1 hypothetical protein B9T31_15240 [Acinetobacter sp. ANC 4558]
MKFILFTLSIIFSGVFIGCSFDTGTSNTNLPSTIDGFQIDRKITFYSNTLDKNIFSIEGKCMLSATKDKMVNILCKTGENEYKKYNVKISKNMTYFYE